MASSLRNSRNTLARVPQALSHQSFSTTSSASRPPPPPAPSHRSPPARRPKNEKPRAALSTRRDPTEPRFNYLPHSSPFDPTDADPLASTYRLLTAKDLERNKEPPKRVRMLVRDFIDDSLYNPNYGYFSTKVDIFDPDTTTPTSVSRRKDKMKELNELDKGDRAEGFEFEGFGTTAEFEEEVARRYMQFEGLDQGAGTVGKGPGRQVWHTPTELFKPWYGRALARYLLATYKLNLYPYSDLIIYEIGAGNGTLMADILDFLAVEAPEVYARTKYRIIEISDRLVGKQKGSVAGGKRREQGGMSEGEMGREKARRRGHGDRVEVIGKSIFEWDRVVHEPCFFIAMEVLDNFAHDVIRYTTDTHEPVQCTISIDSSGDYNELYSPVEDPLISRYLSLRSQLPSTSSSRESRALNPLLASSPLLRKVYSAMPFAPNLTKPEFIPTRQLQLLEVLRDKFPNHRVLMSDFDKLPDAVAGVNAPVVQTRYQGETVPCTTYLVQPGFFDIFFPTDFEALREMYTLVMSQPRTLSSSDSSSQLDTDATTLNPDTLTPSPSPNATPSRLSADFFSPHSHPSPRPTSSTSSSSKSNKKDAVLPGLGHSKGLQVVDHADFLERWGETDRTRDRSSALIRFYTIVPSPVTVDVELLDFKTATKPAGTAKLSIFFRPEFVRTPRRSTGTVSGAIGRIGTTLGGGAMAVGGGVIGAGGAVLGAGAHTVGTVGKVGIAGVGTVGKAGISTVGHVGKFGVKGVGFVGKNVLGGAKRLTGHARTKSGEVVPIALDSEGRPILDAGGNPLVVDQSGSIIGSAEGLETLVEGPGGGGGGGSIITKDHALGTATIHVSLRHCNSIRIPPIIAASEVKVC